MTTMRFVFALNSLLAVSSASVLPRQTPTGTVIPNTVFDSQSDFNATFNYLYPWGSDHNGAARMNESQVSVSSGVLTLTAIHVTGQPPAGKGDRAHPINYLSGAVHAKEKFTVAKTGGFDFYGEFKATTERGTWPAFWLTGADSWPPEIDMAEWKGSGKISFNTFNTSKEVEPKDVEYPHPEDWHAIKAEVRDLNGEDVQTKFYLDGALQATEVGRGYVGKAQWLIINLQMEGSSGSPGPTTDTLYQVRELQVLSYNP